MKRGCLGNHKAVEAACRDLQPHLIRQIAVECEQGKPTGITGDRRKLQIRDAGKRRANLVIQAGGVEIRGVVGVARRSACAGHRRARSG